MCLKYLQKEGRLSNFTFTVFNASLFPNFNDQGIIAALSYQDHPLAAVEYQPIFLDAGMKTTINFGIEEVWL